MRQPERDHENAGPGQDEHREARQQDREPDGDEERAHGARALQVALALTLQALDEARL